MLKPRKQYKRVPITLEEGLLRALKGKLMRFEHYCDCEVSPFSANSAYFTEKTFLALEVDARFASFKRFERLLTRLEEKGVLISAPYEDSTWVVAGDKVAMLKASRTPRAIELSRLKQKIKNRILCSDEDLVVFKAYMGSHIDGLDAFYRNETELNNPYQTSTVECQAWLDGWHEGHQKMRNQLSTVCQ